MKIAHCKWFRDREVDFFPWYQVKENKQEAKNLRGKIQS